MNRRDLLVAGGTLVVSGVMHDALAETAPISITQQAIEAFSPRARPDVVAALIKGWSLATAANIVGGLRVQHFLTEIATETGGLRRLDEDLDYTAAGLMKTFGKRVNSAKAAELAHHPIPTADFVYGGRLGNTLPDDGWTYRGSGYLQLTGRGNFAARGKQIDMNIVDQPDNVRSPTVGFAVAVAYWTAVKGNNLADTDDLSRVRYAVNGGENGLDVAAIWRIRARTAFKNGAGGVPELAGVTVAELDAVNTALQAFGFQKRPGRNEAVSATEQIRSLQQARDSFGLNKLNVAGLPLPVQAIRLYDNDLLYAITDPKYFPFVP